MPDETSPRPSGSPDDADTNAAPDAEIDAVLSQAATLASSLAEEVGESPPMPASSSSHGGAERPAGSSSAEQIEIELAELERLVDVAGTEVVDEPESATQPLNAYEVPEFMSEFTDSSAEAEEEASPDDVMAALDEALSAANVPPESPRASFPDASLGVVGTDMFNADGEWQIQVDVPDLRARGPLGKILAFMLLMAGHLLGRLWEAISPAAYLVCDRIVSLLELIDRPVARLNDSVRRAAGLMALATIGTSLLVFAYSLL